MLRRCGSTATPVVLSAHTHGYLIDEKPRCNPESGKTQRLQVAFTPPPACGKIARKEPSTCSAGTKSLRPPVLSENMKSVTDLLAKN
jgi:hypothetical protein